MKAIGFNQPRTIDDVHALEDIQLDVHAGEVVALVGDNGAGKSTLLRIMNRMTDTTEGRILFEGRDVLSLTGAEKRAPAWMRRFGLEWSYRLLSNPRRLAYRYLVRGPRVLPMLSRYRVSLRTERERSLATNEIVAPDAEPLDAM